MAIADHAIAARAISVPEEGAVATIDILGTVILADQAANGLELSDGLASFAILTDAAASTATVDDAASGSVILADAAASGATTEIRPP